jgi:thiopeptide-type bacteriocin biosynthesis protein
LQAAGVLERWFFIRYADPEPHLRVRMHGAPARLWSEALAALHRAAEPWLAERRLVRLTLDTYEPEIERYGGAAAMPHVERIFEADSDAVLAMVETFTGDAGLAARARLALAGVARCFDAFGLAPAERLAAARRTRDALAAEHRVSKPFRVAAGERFRAERRGLETLLGGTPGPDDPIAEGLAILARRDDRWRAPIEAMRALAGAGALTEPLPTVAGAVAHMHVNRALRAAQRAQELVLYDFLVRLDKAAAARAH